MDGHQSDRPKQAFREAMEGIRVLSCYLRTLDIGASNWGIHPVRELQHKGIVLVAPIIHWEKTGIV